MATEIELKYLVSDDDIINRITALLTHKQLAFVQSKKTLSNCYFDTTDLNLRGHDMGLRVRICNDAIEQTIKTAGKVVGGLHQRPEYNVEITEAFPDLTLFPRDIWQDSQQPEVIQNSLVSLFNTDFERNIWTISGIGQSQIELVFDKGEISSVGSSEAICEIEIELITGKTEDLFHLAEMLFQELEMRPGTQSKAARGYSLYHGIQEQVKLTPLELVPLPYESDIAAAFVSGVDFGLTQLQKVINAYIKSPSLEYLQKVSELLALLRQGFWLFDAYLPAHTKYIRDELSHFIQQLKWVDNAIYFRELTNKTGNYRKKIQYSEELVSQLKLEKRRIPDVQHVIALFNSTRFNELQLLLLKLLISCPLSDEFTEADETLAHFAEHWLDKSLLDLKQAIGGEHPISSEQYINNRKILNRSLLTGSWFGDLYYKEDRLEFRNPWLDIKQGMSELQTLWLLHNQLSLLDEQPKKLVTWQASKVENLLLAIENSRQNALSITPYWHRS